MVSSTDFVLLLMQCVILLKGSIDASSVQECNPSPQHHHRSAVKVFSKSKIVAGELIKSMQVPSQLSCGQQCVRRGETCNVINFAQRRQHLTHGDGGVCELRNVKVFNETTDLIDDDTSVATLFPKLMRCKDVPYPIHGNWNEWSLWGSPCSKTCGGGEKQRMRNCTSPVPSNGGRPCDGSDHESADCNVNPCPVNGIWGPWGDWSSCSGSIRSRSRVCDSPAPANGGLMCPDPDSVTEACSTTMDYDVENQDTVKYVTALDDCKGKGQQLVSIQNVGNIAANYLDLNNQLTEQEKYLDPLQS